MERLSSAAPKKCSDRCLEKSCSHSPRPPIFAKVSRLCLRSPPLVMWEPVDDNPVSQDVGSSDFLDRLFFLKKSAELAVQAINRTGPTSIPTSGTNSWSEMNV